MRRIILVIYRILRRRFHFPALVMATTAILIAIIEIKHPYFFLQDDNRDYYLPYFKHAYDALMNGEIPLFNFHQFLGHPFLSIGQTGALYPVIYISVGLSNLFFGHAFAAIDIEVLIHLLIGGTGMYYMLSYLGIRPRASYLGAITWCFSSMIIITGGSWVIVTGVAAWFPWMAFYAIRSIDKSVDSRNPSFLSDMILLVLARLMIFYQGNVQYFIYSVMFELIFVLVFIFIYLYKKMNKKWIKTAAAYIGGYIATFLLSLPLLLPMWNQMIDSALRSGPLAFDEFAMEVFDTFQWLIGLVNPFMNVNEDMIWAYRRHVNLTFVGYIMLLLVIFMFIYWIKYEIDKIKHKNIDYETAKSCRLFTLALIPGLTAFLMSASYIVNNLVYLIPILNRFRFPFKFQIFTVFFIVIAGCSGLKLLSRKMSGKIRPWLRSFLTVVLIAVQIAGFATLYILGPQRSFGTHKDTPPLSEPLSEVFGNERYLTAGFNLFAPKYFDYTGFNAYTAYTLGFNYATLFGMYQFAGYEQLVSKLNDEKCLWMNNWSIFDIYDDFPFGYAREMGVKWYVVDRYNEDLNEILKRQPGIHLYSKDVKRAVYNDIYAKPLAFTIDKYGILNNQPLDVVINTNSILIKGLDSVDYTSYDTDEFNYWEDYYYYSDTNKLTVNFLYNDFFTAHTTDGKELKISADGYGRIVTDIPDECEGILIVYHDPYFEFGLYVAGISIMIFIFIIIGRRKLFAIFTAKKNGHDTRV